LKQDESQDIIDPNSTGRKRLSPLSPQSSTNEKEAATDDSLSTEIFVPKSNYNSFPLNQ
jgi:hypothetical protein